MLRNPIERDSFIEHDAHRCTIALLDPGTFCELLGPFRQLTSPWLPRQDIVTQADDGVVMVCDTLSGHPTMVSAIEGVFQGDSMGKVSGAKIADALEPAAEDNRNDTPTHTVIVFETGGVQLQEANPGLAIIAEIHAGIRALREYGPVIGVAVGIIGCFGDTSIAAGLCNYPLMTCEARLDLNGPQIIEQEAGTEEYDPRDCPFIRSLTGGEQRVVIGLADVCIEDDSVTIRTQVIKWLRAGAPARQCSEQIDHYLAQLAAVDTSCQATAEDVRVRYAKDAA